MGKVTYCARIWEGDTKDCPPDEERHFPSLKECKEFAVSRAMEGDFYEIVKCEVIDMNGQ